MRRILTALVFVSLSTFGYSQASDGPQEEPRDSHGEQQGPAPSKAPKAKKSQPKADHPAPEPKTEKSRASDGAQDQPDAEAPKNEKPKDNVKRIHRTDNINIKHTLKIEEDREKTKTKTFCAKSAADCAKKCNAWLKAQQKSLKSKVNTSSCSDGRDLYGEEVDHCMNYICEGEIEYMVR